MSVTARSCLTTTTTTTTTTYYYYYYFVRRFERRRKLSLRSCSFCTLFSKSSWFPLRDVHGSFLPFRNLAKRDITVVFIVVPFIVFIFFFFFFSAWFLMVFLLCLCCLSRVLDSSKQSFWRQTTTTTTTTQSSNSRSVFSRETPGRARNRTVGVGVFLPPRPPRRHPSSHPRLLLFSPPRRIGRVVPFCFLYYKY